MTTSSTSSMFGSISGNAIGGLMSGLDTTSLVEQMIQASQAKINREYQKQQELVYEQEAYREVTDMLVNFSDTFFSSIGGNSIFSSGFFQADNFTPSSDYVDVSGDPDAIRNLVINSITSVAQKATHSSSHKVTNGTITSGDVLDSVPVSTLAGQTMSFKVGDTTETITISNDFMGDTLEDVAAEINTQIAANENLNGKINYSVGAGDTLQLNDLDTTDEITPEVTAVGGNIKDILKIDAGSSGTSSEAVDASKFIETKTLSSVFAEKTMSFNYNGSQKTIDLSSHTINSASDLQKALQEELDKAYGTGKVEVRIDNTGANPKLTFKATGSNDTLSIGSVDQDISMLTGITPGATSSVNFDKALNEMNFKTPLTGTVDGNYTINVNGKELTFAETDSVSDIMSKINSDDSLGITMSYSQTTDTFNFTSDETGAQAKIEISDVTGNLAKTLFGGDISKTGQDTKMNVTMNGSTYNIERSTDSFTLDGVTLDLSSKAAGETNISFDVDNNVDEVVANVAKFVDEYNKIIEYLDNAVTERPDSDYAPLTDAQKDEMTETEIKNWEEKARAGALFGDSNIRAVLYDMKDAMGSYVEDVGMLTDIGISYPSLDYSGTLVFDEDAFREAYAADPEKVQDLFAKESDIADEQGLAVRLQSVFETNVGTTGNKGILADHAGTVGMTNETQNYLSERITEYEEYMTTLKEKMEEERESYWAQFTALETALASMNEQLASISGMFE